MMSELVPKKSKTTRILFTGRWLNPKTNDYLYYHEIQFSNGDRGNIGSIEQLPDKLAKGKTIWYTKDRLKIKLVIKPTPHAKTTDGNLTNLQIEQMHKILDLQEIDLELVSSGKMTKQEFIDKWD